MKKISLESQIYELFYVEMPQADYFRDIEIQDEYEDTSDELQGLSEQQVSEIARDSINAAKSQNTPPQPEHAEAEDEIHQK